MFAHLQPGTLTLALFPVIFLKLTVELDIEHTLYYQDLPVVFLKDMYIYNGGNRGPPQIGLQSITSLS